MKFWMCGLLGVMLCTLSAAEPSITLKTADYLTPEYGQVTLKIQPTWDEVSNKLQVCRIWGCRQYIPAKKIMIGLSFGINRHVGGKTYVWFYLNNPDTGKSWGNYSPMELKNNQVYEFKLSWDAKKAYLTSGKLNLMERYIPFKLKLGPTIQVGPVGDAAKFVKLVDWKIEPKK